MILRKLEADIGGCKAQMNTLVDKDIVKQSYLAEQTSQSRTDLCTWCL